jgi:hypothetical protein
MPLARNRYASGEKLSGLFALVTESRQASTEPPQFITFPPENHQIALLQITSELGDEAMT